MKSKRIAIIRPDGNPIPKGFYNSQEIGLAKAIAALGFDIDIFMAGTNTEVQSNRIEIDNGGCVTVYDLPRRMLPEIGQAVYPDLMGILRNHQYGLIQVNESNDLTSFWVSRHAKKHQIPCIIYQGIYEPIIGRILALFDRLFKIFIHPSFKRNINLAVAKTTRAERFLQHKGFDKTTVLPVGLDTEPFSSSEQRDWHEEFNIPKESKILLYIGIFEARRNIHFLVDLAAQLKEKNYYLLMAGKGPQLEEIQERLEKEAVDNVILLGQVPQNYIKSLYQIAHHFLLASDYEIYGMVVLEALYCGCPVISTDTAGPADLIRNGENGYIIPELSVAQWKEKIIQSTDTFDREQITEYISNHLTWRVIAQNYVEKFFYGLSENGK